MTERSILLFGYGNHGKFIAKGLLEDGFLVKIIESDHSHYLQAKDDGFMDVEQIDVTNDALLQVLAPQSFEKIVCVMEDEHLNVFLTLSLRSLFSDSYILAISDSIHATKKLKMAGADKVVDLYEVSANKIYNILHRPVSTKVLESIVLDRDSVTFREIIIPEGSYLHGKQTDEVDFSKHGILLVGMIDEELGHSFVFITTGINHKMDVGDTLVCIGHKDELDHFVEKIKNKEEIV